MPPPPHCGINEAQERYARFKEIMSGLIDDAGVARVLDPVQKDAILTSAREAYTQYTNCYNLGFGRPEDGPIPLSDIEQNLLYPPMPPRLIRQNAVAVPAHPRGFGFRGGARNKFRSRRRSLRRRKVTHRRRR